MGTYKNLGYIGARPVVPRKVSKFIPHHPSDMDCINKSIIRLAKKTNEQKKKVFADSEIRENSTNHKYHQRVGINKIPVDWNLSVIRKVNPQTILDTFGMSKNRVIKLLIKDLRNKSLNIN